MVFLSFGKIFIVLDFFFVLCLIINVDIISVELGLL